MKYLTHFTAVCLLLLAVILTSCTDLNETVYSEVTAENFSPTADDIVSLVAPVYSPLRGGIMGFHTWLSAQHESADVIVTPVRPNGWHDGGRFNRMHRHTWTATDGTPNSVYNMSYSGINAANRVLLQIETGEIPIEQGGGREELIAELKVARAFYYAILLDSHGNVPIVTDFADETLPKQSSRSEVYDFVVQELTSNMDELSEIADQSTYGRFNKWAAKMVLAEVYLNAEVYKGEAAYDQVIEQVDDIIDSGAYELEDNYKDNFIRENQTSSEIIFAVPYDEVNGPGNIYHMSTIRPTQQPVLGLQTQPWGGASSQPQFVDSYDEDDTRLDDTWITGPHYIDVDEGEPENFVKNVPRIDPPGTEFYHGYPIGKYEVYDGIPVDSDVDFPFYRYAETLMMKAEALLRTDQPNEAAALVTQVRERVFEDPAEALVTGAELQQGSSIVFGMWNPDGTISNPDPGDDIVYGRMLDELGWEFAAEGHRRTDLIRFGVFTTKSWLNHEPNGDNKILFPIPEGALNTNTNLVQNPGY